MHAYTPDLNTMHLKYDIKMDLPETSCLASWIWLNSLSRSRSGTACIRRLKISRSYGVVFPASGLVFKVSTKIVPGKKNCFFFILIKKFIWKIKKLKKKRNNKKNTEKTLSNNEFEPLKFDLVSQIMQVHNFVYQIYLERNIIKRMLNSQ